MIVSTGDAAEIATGPTFRILNSVDVKPKLSPDVTTPLISYKSIMKLTPAIPLSSKYPR